MVSKFEIQENSILFFYLYDLVFFFEHWYPKHLHKFVPSIWLFQSAFQQKTNYLYKFRFLLLQRSSMLLHTRRIYYGQYQLLSGHHYAELWHFSIFLRGTSLRKWHRCKFTCLSAVKLCPHCNYVTHFQIFCNREVNYSMSNYLFSVGFPHTSGHRNKSIQVRPMSFYA